MPQNSHYANMYILNANIDESVINVMLDVMARIIKDGLYYLNNSLPLYAS